MRLVLTRLYWSDRQTRGALSVYDEGTRVFSCKTLELAWRDNERRVSCIPPGPQGGCRSYRLCHREGHESGKYDYPHFIVKGVPERDYILLHRGNLYTDVQGCILPGRRWMDLNADGRPDVTHAADTLRVLRRLIPDGTPFRVCALSGLRGADPVRVLGPETLPGPSVSSIIERVNLNVL